MKQQQGFTLVELVIVIVVLGILAAVAVPKFVDLSNEASTAAAEGVAATLSSTSSANFAKKKMGSTDAISLNVANICTTAVLGQLLGANGVTLTDTAPTTSKAFQVAGTGDCSGTAESVTCTIKGKDAKTTTNAVIMCAR